MIESYFLSGAVQFIAELEPRFPSMNPATKTWAGLALLLLVLFEFWSAMRVFGTKESQGGVKVMMSLHRIVGYTALACFVWLSFVGLDMYERLSQAGNYNINPRIAFHVFLAMLALTLLLLKIGFIRFYRKFRPYVTLLGIIITVSTVILWGMAGLMFFYLMGGVKSG